MSNITKVHPSKINVADRARTEMGNLEGLKQSILTNGQLMPVLVDSAMNLIAGGRRTQAITELGLDEIEVKIMDNLLPEDRKVIELIENQDREDFTWHEEIELKLSIHNDFVKQNPKHTYRDTCAKLGCSIGGLSSDLELAKVIRSFPDLREASTKTKARDTYKKLQTRVAATQAVKNLSGTDQSKLASLFGGGTTAQNTTSGSQTHATTDDHGNPGTVVPVEKTPLETPISNSLEPTSQPSCSQTEQPEETLFHGLPPFTYKVCSYRDFLDEIPDGVVSFCELDPPYAIDFDNVYTDSTHVKKKEKDWDINTLRNEMDFLFRKLYQKMMDHTWVLCWTGKEHFVLMNTLAKNIGFQVQQPGIWNKGTGSTNSPKNVMSSQYEMFILLRKGQAQFNTSSFPNVVDCPPSHKSSKGHQWEKPIDLYNIFMKSMAIEGGMFLSLFAGSGAAMTSARINGMTPMGCDINQQHMYRFIELYSNHCRKI